MNSYWDASNVAMDRVANVHLGFHFVMYGQSCKLGLYLYKLDFYLFGTSPYNSLGNGSAMRVSAIGWAFNTVEDVLREAEHSAAVTHNHPEGIKGAQSVALAIFLARTGVGKEDIRREIETRFGYDLRRTLDEIRPTYQWDSTSPGSVPESIIAFLESTDYESAVRNAVLLGGDADTMAAIAGSIAEAFFGGVPEGIVAEVRTRLKPELLDVVEKFAKPYN